MDDSVEKMVIEDENYPIMYTRIYFHRGKKVTMHVEIPHPPSDKALKNFLNCLKKTFGYNDSHNEKKTKI